MIILAIRTDNPRSEISLYKNDQKLEHQSWLAGRELSETIHKEILQLLQNQKLKMQDIEGVVCFEGPGSFTGLRIGISVGNAISSSLKTPIVASGGENWLKHGIATLGNNPEKKFITPHYGAPVHITAPRK